MPLGHPYPNSLCASLTDLVHPLGGILFYDASHFRRLKTLMTYCTHERPKEMGEGHRPGDEIQGQRRSSPTGRP